MQNYKSRFKILIFGFEPFKNYDENISQKIINKIKEKEVITVILPVVFEKKYILKAIEKYNPDIIIGLGQRKGGRILEVERKTKNVFQKNKNRGKINPLGPKEYLLNLKLKKRPQESKIDYHSGDYVCNFTRYVIMDFIKKKKLKTKFLFIHIPKNYNIQKGIKNLKEIISQIKKQELGTWRSG